MTMQVIAGAALAVLGAASEVLGLLFLAASRGMASRLTTGSVLCAAGFALIAAGVVLFRRGIRISPAYIRREILALAKRRNGELTQEAITGAVGSSEAVAAVIANLVREGIATEISKDGRRIYLFKDFQLALVFKKCPYCGNDYPVRDGIEQCPNCGGDLKLKKVALSDSGDVYSMDEEDDAARH